MFYNSEAWRYQGQFSRWNRYKGALPGFGTAAVLFGVYLVYEAIFMKNDHKHGNGEHAEDVNGFVFRSS